ncbi:hypothetical protein [Nocardia brasiliensis]|uniref:Transmembrane protein n=1 Tax=Nocardia brasiliensis (strain ATCC 700358 / HUJEG-1) TaxID=1133849 RepID=K0EVS8_NOCB7|nr:hypothetical protein [Nocardia brasiliensis]AFU00960.1 hypothetical protein O3I_014995 [Nocardia brasiliensis ATCC 700358]OCF84468.1 hypothetical protein AW168_03590 [Nocardia brasiliensis]
MTAAVTALIMIAAALATMVVAALTVPGVARVLLIAQALYWAMSYLARPIVLLWVQPEPRFGDNVADPRLAALGYDHGIAMVLRPVVFGLWVYAGLVVAFAIWLRRRRAPRRAAITDDPNFVPTLCVLYFLGALGRLAMVATGTAGKAGEVETSSPALTFVTMLGTIGAIGLIVFVRLASARATVAAVGLLLAGELLWTVAVESKTPIMGAALAIGVRFALGGWTRPKIVAILLVSILGMGGFGWLQSLKATGQLRADAAVTDAAYPAAVRPMLSVLRRFDLLEAATDVYYTPPGSWLSPAEAAENAARSLIPAQLLGSEKLRSGTAWAADVRGASVDMSQVSVSLAEGGISEGYLLGGYTGIMVGAAFTFALLASWARALYSRHIALVVLGLALIEIPVIFERGILGSMEMLGKYLQAVVLVWFIYLLVGLYRGSRGQLSARRSWERAESVVPVTQRTGQWV